MLAKVYFVIYVLLALLQTAGFVISRASNPFANIDVPSYIFNVGLMYLGSFVLFFYAFRQKPLPKWFRLFSFAFFAAAVGYALYFTGIVIPGRNPRMGVPWLLLAFHVIYIPLLVFSSRYAQRT